MWLKAIADHSGVYNLADYNPDKTGATSSNAAFTLACANGGQIDIPEGTYLLNGFALPTNQGDIVLNPLGPVVIQWNGSSADPAITFANTAVSAALAVTAVTNDNDFPAASLGPQTKIAATAGDFAGYAKGNVCHMMSDDVTFDGFIKGEMFKVAYVAPDTSYIYADRLLFHAYSATTVIRRFTATPKLTIKKGITFSPADSPLSATQRASGLYLLGAVDADIDVEFDGNYSSCITTRAIYGGTIKAKVTDLYMNYSAGAYAYGVAVMGPAYGTTIEVEGDRAGHLVTPNGVQTTYNSAQWYFAGVPDSIQVPRLYSRNGKNAGLDSHWSYNMHFGEVTLFAAGLDTDYDSKTMPIAYLAGVNICIDVLRGRNVSNGISLRDHRGVTTTHKVGRIEYLSGQRPTTTPVMGSAETQTAGSNVTVDFGGGVVDLGNVDTHLIGNTFTVADPGYKAVYRNIRFTGGKGLVRYTGVRPVYTDIHNCVYEPGDGFCADRAVILYTAATNNYVRIFSLDVIKNSSGYPNALVRNYSAVATTTTVGDIRCVNGTLDMIYSSSAVGSTAAILRMGKPSVWVVTQAQAVTNIADVRIIYAKGDAFEYTDPTAGGAKGIVCTTGGAGGTAVFKAFGVIAA